MAQMTENIRDFTAPEGSRRTRQTTKVLGTGLSATAFLGLGTLALGILGLIGVIPATLLHIGIIAAGAAMVLEAAAFAARFSDAYNGIVDRDVEVAVESGISSEAVGGVAVVALGILALVGVAPLTLSSIAVLVVGAALFLNVMPKARMTSLMSTGFRYDRYLGNQGAVYSGLGGELLISLGVIALGVLALVGVSSFTLDLIGLIAAGCAIVLGSGAVGYKAFHSSQY